MIATDVEPTPAELRKRLGHNLQALSRSAPSISALCRELGINRTQFNRYRAGESFPRPDVLYRICRYFKVDARILLEPVEIVAAAANGPFLHSEVRDFLPHKGPEQLEVKLPDGLFRFVRRSAQHQGRYIRGVFRVYRKDGHAFLRGYDPAAAVPEAGERPAAGTREFRGPLLPQGAGYMAVTARLGGEQRGRRACEPPKPNPEDHHLPPLGFPAHRSRHDFRATKALRLRRALDGHRQTRCHHCARTGIVPNE